MAEKLIEIVLTPMTVSDLAEKLHIGTSELILALLRKGIVATRNKVLSEDEIKVIAPIFGVALVVQTAKNGTTQNIKTVRTDNAKQTIRLPIVVVMGHVDHGKTTLLDFIRKTRVALREKGGITQHLGAYRVKTEHGDVVFLDTPGHEAFSMIRVRGITVADIAILIVAADDGVMPQTIEALERARAASLPIIVAINKADKASEKQIEKVKMQLSQHDVITEDWGGTVPCVLISALTGQGVPDLLDLIALQAQSMDLTAALDVSATGYILESHMEKGRGSVATVICQHGTLRVGDHFVCGSMQGRVTSLRDSFGKFVQSSEPSLPVQVAGFSELPKIGDILNVATAKEIKKGFGVTIDRSTKFAQVMKEGVISLIIKTDNLSSKEALENSIQKISEKSYRGLYIISIGIGSLTESDITLAADTKAIVYGLHTKFEPNAAILAQRLGVDVRFFDIIYKLLEDLEELGQKGRPVKMRRKKIGEASVLKVFDIKKLGIVAGAQVTDGFLSREGTVVIYRGKQKVGSGKIVSLQREKNPAKEVRKGFECAFMVEKFDSWEVDDRVECFIDVPDSE